MHSDGRGHLDLSDYSARSNEQFALSVPSIRGRLPCGNHIPFSVGSIPRRNRPRMSAPHLSMFGLPHGPDESVAIPFRFPKEGPAFAGRHPGCCATPAEAGGGWSSLNPGRNTFRRAQGPIHSQDAVVAEGGIRHRLRGAGQILRSSALMGSPHMFGRWLVALPSSHQLPGVLPSLTRQWWEKFLETPAFRSGWN